MGTTCQRSRTRAWEMFRLCQTSASLIHCYKFKAHSNARPRAGLYVNVKKKNQQKIKGKKNTLNQWAGLMSLYTS